MGIDALLPSSHQAAKRALGVSDPRAAQEALQAPAFDPVTLLAGGIGGTAVEGMSALPSVVKNLAIRDLLANAWSPNTPTRNNYLALLNPDALPQINYEELVKDVPDLMRKMAMSGTAMNNMVDEFARGMKASTIYDYLTKPKKYK